MNIPLLQWEEVKNETPHQPWTHHKAVRWLVAADSWISYSCPHPRSPEKENYISTNSRQYRWTYPVLRNRHRSSPIFEVEEFVRICNKHHTTREEMLDQKSVMTSGGKAPALVNKWNVTVEHRVRNSPAWRNRFLVVRVSEWLTVRDFLYRETLLYRTS